MGILDGKRILVAGVTMDTSIGFAVAKVAQEQGATVVVSNFGRALNITKRIVKRLPDEPPVLELDVSDQTHLDRLAEAARGARGRARRGGALHRLRQPGDAARREVPGGPLGRRGAGGAGLGVLPRVPRRGLPAADGCGRVGRGDDLRRDRGLAGLRLDGRGQGRAGVVLALPGPRPRAGGDPGEPGLRGTAAGRWPPRRFPASRTWSRHGAGGPRSAGTSPTRSPTARAVAALLSDFFPATTGEIVHVDGGYHAMGA